MRCSFQKYARLSRIKKKDKDKDHFCWLAPSTTNTYRGERSRGIVVVGQLTILSGMAGTMLGVGNVGGETRTGAGRATCGVTTSRHLRLAFSLAQILLAFLASSPSTAMASCIPLPSNIFVGQSVELTPGSSDPADNVLKFIPQNGGTVPATYINISINTRSVSFYVEGKGGLLMGLAGPADTSDIADKTFASLLSKEYTAALHLKDDNTLKWKTLQNPTTGWLETNDDCLPQSGSDYWLKITAQLSIDGRAELVVHHGQTGAVIRRVKSIDPSGAEDLYLLLASDTNDQTLRRVCMREIGCALATKIAEERIGYWPTFFDTAGSSKAPANPDGFRGDDYTGGMKWRVFHEGLEYSLVVTSAKPYTMQNGSALRMIGFTFPGQAPPESGLVFDGSKAEETNVGGGGWWRTPLFKSSDPRFNQTQAVAAVLSQPKSFRMMTLVQDRSHAMIWPKGKGLRTTGNERIASVAGLEVWARNVEGEAWRRLTHTITI